MSELTLLTQVDYVLAKYWLVCVAVRKEVLTCLCDTRNMSQYKLAIIFVCIHTDYAVLKKIAGHSSSDFFLHALYFKGSEVSKNSKVKKMRIFQFC